MNTTKLLVQPPLLVAGALCGSLASAGDCHIARGDAHGIHQHIAELEQQARQGDPEAKLHLARHYLKGECIPPDEYQAFERYMELAQAGIAEAQFQVGIMYLEGTGVTGNDIEALNWLGRAAHQGHIQAIQVYDYFLNGGAALDC